MSKTAQEHINLIRSLEEKLDKIQASKPKDRRQFDQVYDRRREALREASTWLLKNGWEVDRGSIPSPEYLSGHSDVRTMTQYCWLSKPGYKQIDMTQTSQDKAIIEALEMECRGL
jgi:hypothetical protein